VVKTTELNEKTVSWISVKALLEKV
jgi:hypothetical protein